MNDSFYKSIINDSPMGYAYHKIICDKDGTPCDYEFLEVNSAFEQYTGLKARDIIGEKLTKAIPGIQESEFDWIGVYGNIALNDVVEEFNQFSEPLNKHYRVKAFSPEKGYFITLFNDITEEKTAEKKEIDFKKLFDNMQSGCGIYEVKNDGKYGKDYIVKDFNKESLKIEGKPKKEVIGKSLLELRPNIDEFGLIDKFREVWETGIPKKIPARLYIDENFSSWYENNVFKLSSNEIVAVYNDVTEIMQTQEELKESRNKFKQYIDRAPYGVFIIDETKKYLEVNRETCETTGYTKKELVGKNLLELVADKDAASQNFKMLNEKGFSDAEGKFITKSNEIRDWHVRAIKLSDTRFLGFTEDITKKKELENKLINNESRLKRAQKIAKVGTWEQKLGESSMWASSEFLEILELESDNFYVSIEEIMDCVHSEDREALQERIDNLIEKQEGYDIECRIITKNTYTEKILSVKAQMEYKENGTSDKIIGVLRDITEYRKAQEELVIRDARYNSMISNISDVIGILDENGVIQYSSPNTEKWFGWRPNELIGIHALEMVHSDDVEYVQKELLELLKHPGVSKTIEYRNKCKDGSYKYIQLSSVNLVNDNNINGILVNYHDITERIEKEKNFEMMIKTAMDGFLLFDLKTNILDTNDSYCKLIGYTREELLTMSLTDIKFFDGNDDLEKLTYKTINKSPMRYKSKHRHKNGTIIDVEISSEYLPDTSQFFVFLHDLTEEKRFEKEKKMRDAHQVQQQRLESIGTLAGGVAHEINNPINGIMNYAQLILDEAEKKSDSAEYAEEIIHESERIANIVKNLLQFSRHEKQAHSYASIETIIEQTLSLIKAVMRHDQIDLQVDIPRGLPDIKCRTQQIQQVIMNLLTNARDTLNAKYPGYHEDKIIKLHCKEFNKQNRNWLRITVEDHGTGIPESVKERLFEPFFTTKERDKGTGLGLSISYEIVKNHHGELTFETKEGCFTRFYLELPCDNGWELEGEEDF